MCSQIAQASARPSQVLVPRPTSSRITSERVVALLRMLAVSTISSMKVVRPAVSSSAAPTRVKMRSTRPMVADSAGMKLPAWASSTSSAVWRM